MKYKPFKPIILRSRFRKIWWSASKELRPHVASSLKAQMNFNQQFETEFADLYENFTQHPPNSNSTYSISNVAMWKGVIQNQPKSILEIGSWQGGSAVAFNRLFPDAKLTCIDTWQGSDRLDTSVDPEKLFDQNTANFADRVTKITSDSAAALTQLAEHGKKFDCIYVDASHFEDDVLVDTLLSWRLLGVGGILIWDDYLLKCPPFGSHTPLPAINHFINRHKNQLQILAVYLQVIVQRTAIN